MKNHSSFLSFLFLPIYLTCLSVTCGQSPSRPADEVAVSNNLGVLVDSAASLGSKQDALKRLRELLESYAFRKKGTDSIRVSHSMAYKALPEIINLMTESPQSDAYRVATFLQTSCPKPGKKSWTEWLKTHPSPQTVYWAWPDLAKASGHGASLNPNYMPQGVRSPEEIKAGRFLCGNPPGGCGHFLGLNEMINKIRGK